MCREPQLLTTLHSVATTKQHLVNWTASSIMQAKKARQQKNLMVRENKGKERGERRENRETDREN